MSGPAAACLAWLDPWWDEEVALLWNPEGSYDELSPPRTLHLVPQSAWWALGALAAGDTARANVTFAALCDLQYDEPGTPWHGSFFRFLESPRPKAGAIEWVDYDPNWRQFLGTTFSLALRNGALDAAVASRLEQAIDLAIAGEPHDRVPPTYSNIALMRAWLEAEHGPRVAAEAYADQVVAAFDEHGAFDEYGSPTYYGIDLFALALWRGHSSSTSLRTAGARIEAALWDDLTRWYHADLRNLCGPWDRSYGMDMRSYLALLALFIWTATDDQATAPVPDLARPFGHSHDTCMGPVAELVGALVPERAAPHLTTFSGERSVAHELPNGRNATGWLAADRMIGAEAGSGFAARGQFHPATAHWRAEDGSTSWLRVRHTRPIDAWADTGALLVRPTGDGQCTVLVKGGVATSPTRWQADDVTFVADCDVEPVAVERREDLLVVRYESPQALEILLG